MTKILASRRGELFALGGDGLLIVSQCGVRMCPHHDDEDDTRRLVIPAVQKKGDREKDRKRGR